MATALLPPSDSALVHRASPTDAEPVVATISRAVGTVTDRSPLDLPPLGEVVDTDAVEAIVASEQSSGHLAFEYLEYVVVVHADGDVAVYDAHTGR